MLQEAGGHSNTPESIEPRVGGVDESKTSRVRIHMDRRKQKARARSPSFKLQGACCTMVYGAVSGGSGSPLHRG